MRPPRVILITGATSGIGAALALHYAHPETILLLTGRNEERLNDIAASCRQRGARVRGEVIDVTDRGAMQLWVSTMDKEHPIDLVIANAGISAGTAGGLEAADQVNSIMAINVNGVLNTIQPLLPKMQARRRGQIAIMSSLAGFRGLPSSPAYSASKAAVRVYGEALRGFMQPFGVKVNVICPGYVETPMTAVNEFPMPFLTSVEKAVCRIQKGLEENKAYIAFPLPMYLAVRLLSILPHWLTDPILSKLPGKKSA